MTSPNFFDPEQMPDAMNAGEGLSGASSTSPADHLQGQMNQVGGPLGSVAGWMLSGLAPKLIADAEMAGDTGSPTASYQTGASRVFSHIGSVGSQTTSPIQLLINALMGGGGSGIFSAVASFFTGQWGKLDDVQDGQLALNGQVELLSPLQDYGSVYALGSSGVLVNNTGKAPFDRQVGPMTGCHLASGGIVLDDYGLWDIRCRMAFSWTALSSNIQWEIRVVRNSDGAIFSQQKDYVNDANSTTREIVTTVVIPNNGHKYRVESHITSLAVGREVFGGPAQNRLTAQHITRSTSFQI